MKWCKLTICSLKSRIVIGISRINKISVEYAEFLQARALCDKFVIYFAAVLQVTLGYVMNILQRVGNRYQADTIRNYSPAPSSILFI